MSTVYLATRDDDQFQRRVAVKVVRADSASESALSRFLTERQILASFDHPKVARLYDGGVTAEGLPWRTSS